jgi:hypothetical protein
MDLWADTFASQDLSRADKLAVLLLSVDPEYSDKKEQYEPQAKKLFKKLDIDWPNVLYKP